MGNERDFKIDFIRFLGLTLIVLAHVYAPSGVTSLRAFDVPLMVFVSGLCSKPIFGSLTYYFWKRIKRLYIPTLTFLCAYFILIYIAKAFGFYIPYTSSQIWGSFLLLENPSIGYVWIIRIFILMALAYPFIYRLTKNTLIFFTTIPLIYVVYNYIASYECPNSIFYNWIIVEIIYDTRWLN